MWHTTCTLPRETDHRNGDENEVRSFKNRIEANVLPPRLRTKHSRYFSAATSTTFSLPRERRHCRLSGLVEVLEATMADTSVSGGVATNTAVDSIMNLETATCQASICRGTAFYVLGKIAVLRKDCHNLRCLAQCSINRELAWSIMIGYRSAKWKLHREKNKIKADYWPKVVDKMDEMLRGLCYKLPTRKSVLCGNAIHLMPNKWTASCGLYSLCIPFRLISTLNKVPNIVHFSLWEDWKRQPSLQKVRKGLAPTVTRQKYVNWCSTISQAYCSAYSTHGWQGHFSFPLEWC